MESLSETRQAQLIAERERGKTPSKATAQDMKVYAAMTPGGWQTDVEASRALGRSWWEAREQGAKHLNRLWRLGMIDKGGTSSWPKWRRPEARP